MHAITRLAFQRRILMMDNLWKRQTVLVNACPLFFRVEETMTHYSSVVLVLNRCEVWPYHGLIACCSETLDTFLDLFIFCFVLWGVGT